MPVNVATPAVSVVRVYGCPAAGAMRTRTPASPLSLPLSTPFPSRSRQTRVESPVATMAVLSFAVTTLPAGVAMWTAWAWAVNVVAPAATGLSTRTVTVRRAWSLAGTSNAGQATVAPPGVCNAPPPDTATSVVCAGSVKVICTVRAGAAPPLAAVT